MTTPDQHLEAAIVAAGANKAPRITPADVAANIASEHYFSATAGVMGQDLMERGNSGYGAAFTGGPLDLLTICVLVLRNGFTAVGTSACASPENFNAQIGRQIAKEKALEDVWKVMGYALKNKLANQE